VVADDDEIGNSVGSLGRAHVCAVPLRFDFDFDFDSYSYS
jgi:hypothetical protein